MLNENDFHGKEFIHIHFSSVLYTDLAMLRYSRAVESRSPHGIDKAKLGKKVHHLLGIQKRFTVSEGIAF